MIDDITGTAKAIKIFLKQEYDTDAKLNYIYNFMKIMKFNLK